jgi:hypothetical protein
MVDGFDAALKERAIVQASQSLDLKAIFSKQEVKSATAIETTTALAAESNSQPSNSGLYGAGLMAGIEREGVLLKRAVLDNGISGLRQAARDEWANKDELFAKAVSGLTMGSAIRLLTPKEGVGKAIAATAMVGYFIVDAAKPLVHGMAGAWSARNDHELNSASKELATNLSKFAIDSSIGMATGMVGAKGTGILLESKSAFVSELPGIAKLRQFDGWKETQFSTKKPVGRFLQNSADSVDSFFDKVQDKFNPFKMPPRQTVDLPTEVKIDRIAATSQKIFDRAESEKTVDTGSDSAKPFAGVQFHMVYTDAPRGMDHSDHMDLLINQGKSGLPIGKSNIYQDASTLPVPESPHTTSIPVDAGPAVPDSVPGVELSSLLSKQTDAVVQKSPAFSENPSVSQPKLDLDPAVISKVATVAKASQAQWPKERVMFAEYRDSVQGPSIGVSDQARIGSMLRPEYDYSSKQITDLASQIDSPEAARKAGMLLNLHTKANLQVLARRPDALDYNNFTDELHGSFLEGLRRAGVSESIMSGKVPALMAVTDDNGAGYFTVPAIEGTIERPVGVVPTSMTGLKSVLTGILRHEAKGHNDLSEVVLRFPENIRDDLIGSAVDNAMEARPIETTAKADEIRTAKQVIQQSLARIWSSDYPSSQIANLGDGIDSLRVSPQSVADMTVHTAMAANKIPNIKVKFGDEIITKSEFFKRLLYAEANENTADFIGTESGGADTPLTLGVLLQSLRKGGFLETRNVYGKQFPDGVEPHGIDRWRIKFCAEVMRQLEPNDSVVKEYADALDLYAQKASRPGETSYIFASVDNAGETISIPMHEWDAVIPHIVKAQLDTPLDALKTEKFVQAKLKNPDLQPGEGDLKTLRDITFGHSTTVRNIDTLANRMVDSIHQGKSQLDGNFDNKEFTIGQVYSAGLVAWLRATRRGEDPTESLAKIDAISETLRATYRQNNPHLTALTPRVSTVMKIDTIRGLSVAAQQAVSSLAGQNRNIRSWTENKADWLAGPTGVNLTGDLMDVDKKQKELLGN